jgi:hypothetical protein
MSLFIAVLYAQEEPQAAEKLTEELSAEESQENVNIPFNHRTEMEIKTSTLSELAAWCRTLGLSEGGTREDLSKRLREHFKLSEPKTDSDQDDKRKIITIESAQSSEYFTVDVVNEDYARLKGDVRITLKEGNKIHKISADEILFNRTRSIITASGGVKYERIEPDKTETFRGRSITVNIDNWASVFIDGKSTMEDDGSSYLFSGSVIYRNDQDVTILRKARISSGADENEYWSIRASRLWLLPGSDFAIFNAVLNVGEIPVLYIPFFYFPSDDIVFHPVLGYRSREGGFVQTTTYLIGQPKVNKSESSLSKIIGNSGDNEKELQGLFLRNTSKPISNKNSTSLKALFDYYVNLGTYAGLELTTPKIGILNQIDLTIGLGFTRTISETSFGYSPFAPNYDGNFELNESNFFSETVPFRYRINFSSGISGKYGSISWSIPYHSDPYVDRDFTKRAESMDWMNMIQQGAAVDETSSNEELGSYQWQMTGNLNPSLPMLSPVISNISISNISTTLNFKYMTDSVISSSNIYSPNRFFYAPDKYTIYSVSGSISGTPVTVGGTSSKSGRKSDSNTQDDSANDPFNGVGVPISPWSTDNNENEKTTSTEILVPPVFSQTFTLPSDGNTKFSVDYSILPTTSSELQFMNQKWKTYEEVDWNEKQSIVTSLSGNTNLNFHIDHSTGLFTNLISFTGSGAWRDYSYLNEELYTDPNTGIIDEDAMEKKRREQYSLTNYTTSYNYNGTIKPFYSDPIFAQTSLQYTLRGTLVKSRKFTNGNGPELEPEWGSWVKEELSKDIPGLNSHNLTANFAANIMDMNQNISVSAQLPPLDGLIKANATFRVWITETTFNYNMEKPETENEWIIKPFDITEKLNFGKIGSFSHNMVFTPDEDNQITYLKSTLSLWSSFNAYYIMTWTKKSIFIPENPNNPQEGGHWDTEGDNELRPKELNFSFNPTFPKTKLFGNRLELSFNINTSLKFDLQQHTNSNFEFRTGLNVGITDFLELTISATSLNAVIFRYFKGVSGMEELTSMYPEGDQNNLFIDLFDSFNFFDESKRRRSGFKMQSLNLGLSHHLGDWTAKFTIDMYPYQKPAQPGEIPSIKITSDISFLIEWKPIKEIKSDIKYTGKTDRWTMK